MSSNNHMPPRHSRPSVHDRAYRSPRKRSAKKHLGRERDIYLGNSTPTRKHDIYLSNPLPSRKRTTRMPWLIGGGIGAIALIVVLACGILGQMPHNDSADDDTSPLATSDTAHTSTELTLTFAGDCTLGTDENFNYSTSFNARYDAVDDPSWFFANVKSIFDQDDLTIVNMEGTLTEATTRADKTFAFKGPAEYAKVLVEGGVEAASMANNHSRDYGKTSYTDTIETLEAANIDTFGYERISYQDVNGIKVALIGAYELAEGLGMQDDMVDLIDEAREEGAQLVAVYIHWGIEKDTVPNETQVTLGHVAVDAGADVVIGSHPHVIQGYEKYHGRYIVYSLGNFCFGGNSNPSDKDCMIFQQTFTVTDDAVAQDDNITVIPCSISSVSESNNYQPTPASGDEKARIEEKIETSNTSIAALSKQISSTS